MTSAWPSPGRDLDPARWAFPARVIVDPAAIAHNYTVLAGATNAASLAVVKANAYGHGLTVAARAAYDAGCRWFGVAQGSEALALARFFRAEAITDARVLTWIFIEEQVWELVAAGVDVTVSEPAQVLAAAAAAAETGQVARMHLKIDTGMSRGGATAADFGRLLAAARQASDVGHARIVGLWSHLARADEGTPAGAEATRAQTAEFEDARARMVAPGCAPEVAHLAASAGGLWHPATHADLVRWGIALYGYAPSPAQDCPVALRPAMCVEARLTLVKRVEAGRGVSYGGLTRLDEPRWVGVVPLGYANGIPRLASARAWVSVNGHRVRQLGRVCMDQFVIDLGPADAQPLGGAGDLVAVLGGPGPDAACWAQWADTISYEILTGIGQGVPRRIAAPTSGEDA